MFAVRYNYDDGRSQLCVFNAGYYGGDCVSLDPDDLGDAASVWIVPGTLPVEQL